MIVFAIKKISTSRSVLSYANNIDSILRKDLSHVIVRKVSAIKISHGRWRENFERVMFDYCFRRELATVLNAGSPTIFLFRFDIVSRNGSHAQSTISNVIRKAAN